MDYGQGVEKPPFQITAATWGRAAPGIDFIAKNRYSNHHDDIQSIHSTEAKEVAVL